MPPKGTTRKRHQLQHDEEVESLPAEKRARLDSPNRTSTPESAPAKERRGRPSNASIAATQQAEDAAPGSTIEQPWKSARNVFEIPDSGDELAAPVVQPSHVKTTPTARPPAGRTTPNGTGPIVKGSASGRKVSARRTTGEAIAEPPQQPPLPPNSPNAPEPPTPSRAAPAPPTPSKATPSKPKTKSQLLRELRQAGSRGLQGLAELERAVQEAPAEQITPSAKKRLADKESDITLGTPLKSILTPQKNRTVGRPRKNVAFNNNEENTAPGEVFFEDLPTKPPTKSISKETPKRVGRPPAPKPAVQVVEVQEEDEEVCSICKKPDSKRGNQILFCDGCDMAVHQKCYDIPTVPKGDWFCRNCTQNDTVVPQKKVVEKPTVTAAAVEEEVPDIPGFEQHLRRMQRILIDRCTGRRRIPLRGQEEAYDKAYQLVEQTVLAGEGNSMMVIGARGSGKTTLVESIVSTLAKDNKDQFHVVRLNGFIHTDDKIALKEIWRQLGKEMEVEDDLINRTNNYADTLASLLAVLSHPSEIVDTQQGVTSKSVIFIIDEFDLFATHARQTLLYNLFDIAQARKAPIAVLGLTTRIDVVETLEKRVKSRFSHRYVYLSLAKSLPAFWDICKQGLTVEDEDLDGNADIGTTHPGFAQFLDWWNSQVETLHRTSTFHDNLEYHFHSTKSVPAFLASAVLPLSSLTPASPSLIRHFNRTLTSLSPPDSKLHLLPDLSDLDLSLLIAAARLDIVAHTDTVNFAMAYDEYTSLMGRQRVQSASSGLLALGGGAKVWGRGVAGCSWERLVSLGLLIPAGLMGRGAGGAGGLEAKMWRVDVALEEIPGYVRLNGVLARWCREI